MTLTNPKPLGWAYGELLTSTQMNSIGTQLPYAVDGNAGGSYAPSSAITIGGSGLTTTGPLTISGPCTRISSIESRVAGIASSYQIEIPLAVMFQGTSGFERFAATADGWLQMDVTDQGLLVFPIPVPPFGCKINEIHVLLDGGSAHAALPATMPLIYLMRYTGTLGASSIGAGTVIGSTTDASASVAAYQQLHLISSTGLNQTINQYDVLQLRMQGETGANASIGQVNFHRAWMIVTP